MNTKSHANIKQIKRSTRTPPLSPKSLVISNTYLSQYSSLGDFRFNFVFVQVVPLLYVMMSFRTLVALEIAVAFWIHLHSEAEMQCTFPANIYLLKVINRKTRKRCQICSKLTNFVLYRRSNPIFKTSPCQILKKMELKKLFLCATVEYHVCTNLHKAGLWGNSNCGISQNQTQIKKKQKFKSCMFRAASLTAHQNLKLQWMQDLSLINRKHILSREKMCHVGSYIIYYMLRQTKLTLWILN